MAFFKKKKKEEEEKIPILREKEELERLVRKYEAKERPLAPAAQRPEEFTLESREYREFQAERAEAEKPHTFYERACQFAGRHLQIRTKPKDEAKLNEVLYFIGYHIKAGDVMSLSILCLLIFLILGGLFLIVNFAFSLITIFCGILLLVLVQKYPAYRSRVEIVDTMNSIPLAISYMVIYMRSSPTLEGAVEFTSKHLPGSLGRDLRKLLWDLESGIYTSMDEALADYAAKWQDKNRNFASAIEMIRNSQQIRNEVERLAMLDKASSEVLKGNLETMQKFAQGLRMPIIALYMLCIVLPVMGLVIAPVMTSLMAQQMSARGLILVYNILLPVIVYLFIKIILSKRPGSFRRADIAHYPGLPAKGRFMIKTKEKEIQVPLLPVSIIVFFLIAFPGLLLFAYPLSLGFNLGNIFRAMTIILGVSAAIIVYTLGSSYQKLKIRNELEDLESGLGIALYQLGDKLAMGIPLEHAMAESAMALKKGSIRGLFLKINTNMTRLGMPLRNALFDKEAGALRYYPSKLVQTIMEVLVESADKGLIATSVSMKTISRYMDNLRKVKSNIEELIGSTVSSMKFQAQFLTSFIAGIIIALDVLLFKILSELGGKITELQLPTDISAANVAGIFKNSMFNVASMVPPEHMLIIVGVYMIQVTVLLSLLINGVENGKDDIYKNYAIGTNLLVSTIVYAIALVFGVIMFASFRVGMG